MTTSNPLLVAQCLREVADALKPVGLSVNGRFIHSALEDRANFLQFAKPEELEASAPDPAEPALSEEDEAWMRVQLKKYIGEHGTLLASWDAATIIRDALLRGKGARP